MSDAENPIPTLPDAKTFLEGKDGIKPLQHQADTLTQFAAGFEEVPLAPPASEKLVQLGDVMKKPHWAGAHDAAHDALRLANENPAYKAYNVESLWKSRAPDAATVRAFDHAELKATLEPLATYLEKFGNFIRGWTGLTPSQMRPKGENATTPAVHRATTQAALDALRVSHPDAVIPECGDLSCTMDHSVQGHHQPTHEAPPVGSGHVHGPGCGHDHAPSGGVHEPHLPKSQFNRGWWVAGMVATVGIGAYLINEYGKMSGKKKEGVSGSADWKQRITAEKTERQRS